jgi:hypothetical protein
MAESKPQRPERVLIQRRAKTGQIWKVLIEGEEGAVIDLPVQNVSAEFPANNMGHVIFRVGSHRISFEDLTEKQCGYGGDTGGV